MTKPSQEQEHSLITTTNAWRDVLFFIFEYLQVHELLKAAQVCRMWRDVAASRSSWKIVRMKNCKITDWEKFGDTLEKQNTQYLDLRNISMTDDCYFWGNFINVILQVELGSLMKLELCKCPPVVVEVCSNRCPQLKILNAMSIESDVLNLESISNLKQCKELRLKAEHRPIDDSDDPALSLWQDLTPLQELIQLTHLSLTSIKDLATKNIDIIQKLTNLESLELGECYELPQNFGSNVLQKLKKLKRIRLEDAYVRDIAEGISKLENLSHVEIIRTDVLDNWFKHIAKCKNIKRLLVTLCYTLPITDYRTNLFPTILEGVKDLSHTLTHLVFGIPLTYMKKENEMEIYCDCIGRLAQEDSMSVIKPLPQINWIKNTKRRNPDTDEDNNEAQVDFSLLQKLLITALPNTRIIIIKMVDTLRWQPSIFAT